MNTLLLFLLFTTVFWYFMLLFERPMKIEYCVLILLFQTICSLFNSYIRNILLYIGLHFLLFYILYHLSLGLHASTLFTLILVVLCVKDFNYWTGTLLYKELPPPFAMVILFFITNIHGGLGLSASLSEFSYYAGIIFITLYLLRLYLINIVSFYNTNDNDTPVKRIVHLNSKIVTTIILTLFLFTVLFQSKTVERIFAWLLKTIGLLFKKVLIFLLSLSPNSEPKDYDITPTKSPTNLSFVTPDESIINKILYWLGIIYQYLVGFAILAFFMFIFFRFIIHYFQRTQTNHEQDSDFDIIEVREKIQHKRKIRTPSAIKNTNINDKIRKLYKKRLRRLHSQGYKIQITQTPLERREDIHNTMNEDLIELTNFYNEARYGNNTLNEMQYSQAKKSK